MNLRCPVVMAWLKIGAYTALLPPALCVSHLFVRGGGLSNLTIIVIILVIMPGGRWELSY